MQSELKICINIMININNFCMCIETTWIPITESPVSTYDSVIQIQEVSFDMNVLISKNRRELIGWY